MKFLALALLLFPLISNAESSRFSFPQGTVSLRGDAEHLGVAFEMIPEWHIYWKNSGDSGAAPKWNWNIKNAKVTAEHWPIPKRIPISDLVNLGYEKKALFVFDIEREKADVPVVASLKIEFLICKVECIPYITELRTEIPANKTSKSVVYESQDYPNALPFSAKWTIKERVGDFLHTELQLDEGAKAQIRNLEIFPVDGETFKPSVPKLDVSPSAFRIDIPLQDVSKTSFVGSEFLLVLETNDKKRLATEISLSGGAGPSFFLVLLWALIGGVILNVMPCVFPVLSIKVLSFLGPERDRKKLRTSGWFYTAGVVISFLALGGALLVLRAAGEQIGWGFQLQTPEITVGIALLFFWLGLNFLGTYEIGNSLTRVGGTQTSSSHWGSFLTGVLATVVATPCTAPFMGAALGASLSMPTLHTLAIFLGLGFGMASPFLLLACFPDFLRFLPKPGMWMVRLKEFLAFPLFATVVWLAWVLSYQLEKASLIYLMGLLLFVSFWVWLSRALKKHRQLFLAIGFLVSFGLIAIVPREQHTELSILSEWKDFSQNSVETDLSQGRPVFIDFTAAWCITCQVNKKLVLNTEEIQSLFRKNEVQLYRADWTDRNPRITEALARYGRNSLPLYVYYYPKTSKPYLLPEILTPNLIRDLFNKKEKTP